MKTHILVTLLTLLRLRFATAFSITQENFSVRALNASWVSVERANFTNNIFTMRIRILRTLAQHQATVTGYQTYGSQLKPTPFNWEIDVCKMVLNPIKYNLVIGSFFMSMSMGNNIGMKCPVPANHLYVIDNYELKATFLPKFFPPGHFVFIVTTMSGKNKLLNIEWMWEISHHSVDVAVRDKKINKRLGVATK